MKKIIFKASLFLFAVILFAGCEQELIKFDASTKLVGFNSSTLLVSEADVTSDITLFLGSGAGATATVALEVSTEGIDNPAVEGVDFTLSSNSVQLDVGETDVSVTTIDNAVFTGDKQFILKITVNETEYTNAYVDEVLVTISDDEHPLKNWLGTYSVSAISYDGPGVYDEDWTVIIAPVPDNLDQVSVTGISGSSMAIIGTVDKDNLTISFDSDQNLGTVYGADDGDVHIFYGDDMKDITWTEPPDAIYDAAAITPIVVTSTADGTTLTYDGWAHIWVDYPWVYDVFNTTWTKQ